MEYTKINCLINPDSEINREILVAELGVIGYESFTETDLLVEAYIPSSDFSVEKLNQHFSGDFTYFQFSWTSEVIADQNWNEVWEKNYFQPLLVDDLCLIRAPFHTDYPENATYEIVIEPGMAFGTGNHETTCLMISEILREDLAGKSVLDMGCGTGILTILAAMKGAENMTAIDIDSWAVKSTRENIKYNCVVNPELLEGGAEIIPDKKFDFIYANIHRNILLEDMPYYLRVMKPGGELIMSGFYNDDLAAIKQRASELGLQFSRFTEKEKWVAAVFTSE